MRGDGKRCGSRLHPLRYCFVVFRHSHVVVVASWEVAAHVKCDRVLAALRPDKAHSRYLKTFLRSDWNRVMFAASFSHQCAPKSSRSSAFAKPFRPAHGPPFRWLYSSSSTAKFQSGAVISTSTLESRCLLRLLLVSASDQGKPLQRRTKTKMREKGQLYSKLEQKHIGAADQPYRNPYDVSQPYQARGSLGL